MYKARLRVSMKAIPANCFGSAATVDWPVGDGERSPELSEPLPMRSARSVWRSDCLRSHAFPLRLLRVFPTPTEDRPMGQRFRMLEATGHSPDSFVPSGLGPSVQGQNIQPRPSGCIPIAQTRHGPWSGLLQTRFAPPWHAQRCAQTFPPVTERSILPRSGLPCLAH